MKKLIIISLLVLLFLGVLLLVFSNGDKNKDDNVVVSTTIPEDTNVVPKGSRVLGIDITEGSNTDYGASFLIAKDLGAEVVQLSFGWDDIEASPEVYKNEFLSITNSFYPSYGSSVALVVSPIDTNVNRLPQDLKDKPLNDPEVIARFNKLLDYIFSEIPDLQISSLSIGNEIDVYLGTDSENWVEYQEFFKETSDHAKSLRPGLKVGSKATFEGYTTQPKKDYLLSLNKNTDLLMVTYYPINSDFTMKDPSVVSPDFDNLISIYPNKEIRFLEAGYSSGSVVDSSEQKQAEFIKQVMQSWDKHRGQITLINFVWLHDLPQSKVNDYSKYYGIGSNKFGEYLRTLGLRTYKGKDKLAMEFLKQALENRGW